MEPKALRELVYCLAKARVFLSERHAKVSDALSLLDRAAELCPDKMWPLDIELMSERVSYR